MIARIDERSDVGERRISHARTPDGPDASDGSTELERLGSGHDGLEEHVPLAKATGRNLFVEISQEARGVDPTIIRMEPV